MHKIFTFTVTELEQSASWIMGWKPLSPTTLGTPIYLFRWHTSGLQISFAGHTAASIPPCSRGLYQRFTSSQSYMIRIHRYQIQIHFYCLIIQNYTFLEKMMLPIECLGQNYGVSDASTRERSFVGLVLVANLFEMKYTSLNLWAKYIVRNFKETQLQFLKLSMFSWRFKSLYLVFLN